jgi:DNA polymerase-1
MMRPTMLVDAMNLFCRFYVRHPAMSRNGEPMGGVVGTLYALRQYVELMRPTDVVIAWEGGGSLRRRQLFPEYKSHRRPDRLNRFYEDDIPNTVENRDDQVRALVECLKHVPTCQVYASDCEADDVIAYMRRTHYRERHVVIISSDRDYYQLIDDNTRIFRPGKKTFVTKTDVLNEFGISPTNFPLAKALCGDPSDNIPGVKGVGFKTLARRFPSLSLDDVVELDALLSECKSAIEARAKIKVYNAIINSSELIRRNQRLVDLDGNMMGPEQRRKVDHVVQTFEPRRDKIGLIRELLRLGINDFNADEFFYTMCGLTPTKGTHETG